MKLGVRVAIVFSQFVRALFADQFAECQQALGETRTVVNTGRQSLTSYDPYKTTTECRKVLFTDLFPTNSCRLSVYPGLDQGIFAGAEFTREAAFVGIQRVAQASSINQIGLGDALAASSVDLATLKEIAAEIVPRFTDLVDSQCLALIPGTGDRVENRLKDFSMVHRIRELLVAAPGRDLITWPDAIISPASLLSRPDTRHFVQSLFDTHNLKALLLKIQDIQATLAQQLSNPQDPSQVTPTLAPTQEPEQEGEGGAGGGDSTPPTTDQDGGSGNIPQQGSQSENGLAQPEIQSEREKDIAKFSGYLNKVPLDRYDQAIIKLKELEATGSLPDLPGFAPDRISDLEKVLQSNPSFKKHDNRDASKQSSPDIALSQTDTDQNAGLVAIGEELQALRQELGALTQRQDLRLKELGTLIEGLTSKLGNKQAEISGSSLQVQLEALRRQVQGVTHCCEAGTAKSARPSSKADTLFYSLQNLNKVYGILQQFIQQYRTYQLSIPVVRQRRNPSNHTQPRSKKSGFKKLKRSGNIFADTLQNTLALNEIISAYDQYSGIIDTFHPQQLHFVPKDYVRRSKELLGLPVNGTIYGNSNSSQSLYQKVISAVQSKYPDISECCLVAYIGAAFSTAVSLCGLAALLISYCCCCRFRPGHCCCQTKSLGEICGGSACCSDRPEEDRPEDSWEPRLQGRTDNQPPRQTSRTPQRSSAPSRPTETFQLLPSDPVAMWDTVIQHSSPNKSHTQL